VLDSGVAPVRRVERARQGGARSTDTAEEIMPHARKELQKRDTSWLSR
jgi:hypothetical protein